jgi:predicted DNA-binding protein with PD1-like motif
MYIKQFEQGRIFVLKLDYKSDLLESLNRFCLEEKIRAGHVRVIGAVSSLRFGFFDQAEHVYKTYTFDEPMEIVSCIGNISLKEEKPICHLHISASDKSGKCVGGHLTPGTAVFAGEAVIHELLGEDLIRDIDEQTQLHLWK